MEYGITWQSIFSVQIYLLIQEQTPVERAKGEEASLIPGDELVPHRRRYTRILVERANRLLKQQFPVDSFAL